MPFPTLLYAFNRLVILTPTIRATAAAAATAAEGRKEPSLQPHQLTVHFHARGDQVRQQALQVHQVHDVQGQGRFDTRVTTSHSPPPFACPQVLCAKCWCFTVPPIARAWKIFITITLPPFPFSFLNLFLSLSLCLSHSNTAVVWSSHRCRHPVSMMATVRPAVARPA